MIISPKRSGGFKIVRNIFVSVIFLLALGLMFMFPQPSPAEYEREALLVVERDETCMHGMEPDHMMSTDEVSVTMPDGDGPIRAEGHYNLSGTDSGGYGLSGPSVYQGRTQGDVLALHFGQWFFGGTAMTSSPPEMPAASQQIHIPLKDGGIKRVEFSNAHADKGPCSGVVVYRLEMEEKQRWQIFLSGYRSLIYRELQLVRKPGSGKFGSFDYQHGATFSYVLSAQIVLTKQKGVWRYTSGTIDKAEINYEYTQTPELYKVIKRRCPICDQFAGYKGQAISGEVLNGSSVRIHWPIKRPVLYIHSKLQAGCASGKYKSTCERLKTGADIEFYDSDFLGLAAGHVLPLANGKHNPPPLKTDTEGYDKEVAHHYVIKRLR